MWCRLGGKPGTLVEGSNSGAGFGASIEYCPNTNSEQLCKSWCFNKMLRENIVQTDF